MTTRRAVGFMQPGGPDVLQVVEMPVAEPGPGEVAVRVAAAAVNPTDIGMRSGAYGRPTWDPPYVPGMDAAGTVEAVGPGVDIEVGTPVMAVVAPRRPEGGAYAERITVPATQVIGIPQGVTVEQAATLPMNGLTAKITHDALDLQPGQTFGVTGAAGVLGGYAIAALHRGLRVIADAKPEDEALVRSFGAHEVIARGDSVGERMRDATGDGVDGLLNAAPLGGEVLAGVRDGGQVAAVRAFNGESERGIRIHRIMVFKHLGDNDGLALVRDLASRGEIALRVAGVFAPEEAADAHRRFEQGGVRGRFIITF